MQSRCQTHSSIFKVCMLLNAVLKIDPIARYIRWIFWNAELNVEPILDIQNVYVVKCRAEYWSHSSIFKMNILVCRAECRSRSAILKLCMGIECRAKCRSKTSLFSVDGVECRDERQSHSSMLKINIFESSADCRTHSSKLKMQSWMSTS